MTLFSALPGPLRQLYNQTLTKHYGVQPTPTMLSMMSTIALASLGLGILFGIFLGVPLIDTRGRKTVAVHIRCILGLMSCALQALSGWLESAELFILGQLILGVLIPIDMVVIPIFVVECAPNNHRGFASVALQVGHMLAVLMVYWMCLPSILGTYRTWAFIPTFGIVLCLLLYATTIGIYDSPKWLIARGKKTEAMKALRFYQGLHESQERVMGLLCLESCLTTAKSMNIKTVWKDIYAREAIKVIIAVQIMFTFSPITIERGYSVITHTSLGLTVEQSLKLSWLSTLLLSPLIFLSTFALDKLGRRPVVFIAASILFSKTLLMFAAQLLVFSISTSRITRLIAVVNEFATDFVFSTGAGAVASLLVAELVPPAARVATAQILLFVSLLSSVPIATPFPIINAIFAPATYAPMLICQPFIFAYLVRNLPETKLLSVFHIVRTFEEEVRSRVNKYPFIGADTTLEVAFREQLFTALDTPLRQDFRLVYKVPL
ncbi:unnamed protein product [Strongylus vulgaris]|uniref:Major facilitator superfamily (MFS) profile domain-containing protein n=1 Tax=Strongylus vulgaris TaxID=40348 RepID=A0A3P7LGU8_STRVU|nr:unnamed protein product [Strongylus vulgaris]